MRVNNPKTVGEYLIWARKKLDRSTTPELDARVLLASAMKVGQTKLWEEPDKRLTRLQSTRYRKLTEQRAKGVPVAYLLGVKEFCGLEFKVSKDVLIPRPETEAIVKAAVDYARANKINLIYEIGTGSGAIAVALAKQLPKVKVIASDISSKALKVAKKNVGVHRVAGRVKLVRANLIDHIKKAGLVVANLPYLPADFKVERELTYEPKVALYAAKDGLELYRKMFESVRLDCAVIELGRDQHRPMLAWLKQKYPKTKITLVRNIAKTICGLLVRLV